MKKIVFLFFLVFTLNSVYSQVFNTGRMLKTGTFSAGINPVIRGNGQGRDIVINLHGGYGLGKQVSLLARYAVFEGADYLGAGFEWQLKHTRFMDISMIAGAHMRYDIGLDGSLCISFPVTRELILFTGLDIDLEFGGEMGHYTWLPLGAEVYWRNRASIILEADLPMSEWAWNIFGGGVKFYF